MRDLAQLRDRLAIVRADFDRLRPHGVAGPLRERLAQGARYFQADLDRWRTVHAEFAAIWRRNQPSAEPPL